MSWKCIWLNWDIFLYFSIFIHVLIWAIVNVYITIYGVTLYIDILWQISIRHNFEIMFPMHWWSICQYHVQNLWLFIGHWFYSNIHFIRIQYLYNSERLSITYTKVGLTFFFASFSYNLVTLITLALSYDVIVYQCSVHIIMLKFIGQAELLRVYFWRNTWVFEHKYIVRYGYISVEKGIFFLK